MPNVAQELAEGSVHLVKTRASSPPKTAAKPSDRQQISWELRQIYSLCMHMGVSDATSSL